MRKKLVRTFKIALFVSCVFAMTLPQVSSVLLDQDEVRQDTYSCVRVWHGGPTQSAIVSGANTGHASVELVQNGETEIYFSMYPSPEGSPVTGCRPRWNTKRDDRVDENLGRYSPETVKIYSLHPRDVRAAMRGIMANDNVLYGLLQTDLNLHCASSSRLVLQDGGITDLWPKRGWIGWFVEGIKNLPGEIVHVGTAHQLDQIKGALTASKLLLSGELRGAAQHIAMATGPGGGINTFRAQQSRPNICLYDPLGVTDIVGVTPERVRALCTEARNLEVGQYRRTQGWN